MSNETAMEILWAENIIKNAGGVIMEKNINFSNLSQSPTVKEALTLLVEEHDYLLEGN